MPKQVHNIDGAPRPVGPYSVATEAGGFVFLSGQIGVDPESGLVVASDVEAQTHRALQNAGRVLEELGLDFGDVVKTTVYLGSMEHFQAMNSIYAEYMGRSLPARTTIAVSGLPLGVAVEIDLLAAR